MFQKVSKVPNPFWWGAGSTPKNLHVVIVRYYVTMPINIVITGQLGWTVEILRKFLRCPTPFWWGAGSTPKNLHMVIVRYYVTMLINIVITGQLGWTVGKLRK